MTVVRKLTSNDACTFVASMLAVLDGTFKAALAEFSFPRPADDLSNWSMPEIEARFLYAIARVSRPETILELGTHLGYSTMYFRKALEANNKGRVVTLDHTQHHNGVARLPTSSRVMPLTTDGLAFSRTLCFPVDIIFEDGDHSEAGTCEFLSNCLPHLEPRGIVIVHDVCYPGMADGVVSGMTKALGPGVELLLIDDSPCGLGLWIKP